MSSAHISDFALIQIEAQQGDLTQVKVDAIVNPANSFGIMGGGVAGVIKRIGAEICRANS